MNLTTTKPFSNGDMKRVGTALKEGRDPDPDKYAQIIDWYEDLNNEVAAIAYNAIKSYADTSPHLPLNLRLQEATLPSTRIKSDDTIREKLVRLRTKLDRIQDFAGCRFDLRCTPSAQREIAKRLKSEFERYGADVKIKDYLQHTQHGYRGVHLHVTAPAGRCELQIRTLPQAGWANVNEVLGDLYGRKHRYEDIDETHPGFEIISLVEGMSEEIKACEEMMDDRLCNLSEMLSQSPRLANDPGTQEMVSKLSENMSDVQMRMVKLLERTASTLRQRGVSQ